MGLMVASWRIHLLPCKICRTHIHRKQTQTSDSSFPKEPSIEYFHFFLLVFNYQECIHRTESREEERGHQNFEIASHQMTLHCGGLSSLTFFLCILKGNKSWPSLCETFSGHFCVAVDLKLFFLFMKHIYSHLILPFARTDVVSIVNKRWGKGINRILLKSKMYSMADVMRVSYSNCFYVLVRNSFVIFSGFCYAFR
jgi:hypothetical protein